MPSKKYSLDLAEENKAAVKNMAHQYEMKMGPFINFLIKTILVMPENVKNSLRSFCIQKYQENSRKYDNAGEFEKKEIKKEIDYYLNLAKLFNGGISIDFTNAELTMKKKEMKDGVLVIPQDWIVLNPEQEGKCKYVGVVECRNNRKYGIPVFVFYTDYQYPREYSEDYIENIYGLCESKWPRFQEIISKQVEAIPDPYRPGIFLNAEEFLNAPTIGLFSIPRNDDELFDGHSPYGAFIAVKKEK